jgi:TfoX/Sxy family transcriptional regulator of competence genes
MASNSMCSAEQMPAATPGSDAAVFYTDQRKALLSDPSITEKKMFGTTALFVGGKVFMFPWKDTLVVKIPAARIDELIACGQAELFDPGHGRTSKTWASVFVSARNRWQQLAQEARAFVQG